MKKFSGHSDKRKSVTGFLVIVFLLLINFSAFCQSVADESNLINENRNNLEDTVKNESSRVSSNMELIIWFMGSKQDPNTTFSKEAKNTKKEIISSGLAPNRLLIRAFFRKAADYDCLLS